jgi:hypothetical protein
MDPNKQKKHSTVGIISLILLFVIIISAAGLFWLYKIERSAAKESTNPLTGVIPGGATTGGASGSGITAFYDRLKSLYDSYKTDAQKKSNSDSKSGGGSTSGSSTGGTATGVGGTGEGGVLDTDVPWREEGEPDLDYSNLEVRACGAAVKGPPTETIGTAEFEQAYQDYLVWIDTDCRAAYAEAGKEYPF